MTSTRPNIIFILADDMGYGDVGCFNPASKIPTPNIDRLATEGRRFTDAHSPSSVCTPSRYGVLTGRYCWRSPLKHGVLYGYEPPLIERDRPTVASLLAENGYHTACIGKWHLGLDFAVKPDEFIDFNRPLPWGNASREQEEKIDFSQPVGGGPITLGFNTFFGTSGCPTCQPPYGFIESDRFVAPPSSYEADYAFTGRPGMTSPGWDHKDADPILADKAVAYIKEQAASERPFFLYLSASAPHEPCVESLVPQFARGRSDAGPRGDLVWLFDWMVGQVMDALEETGQADNTLILVTSDNGALPGDRLPGKEGMAAYRTYGHHASGDWRGYKSHIWEGGHREPLVARWPDVISPNSACDDLVCLVDLMATCAAILDVDLPVNAAPDSISFLPLLTGDASAKSGREDLIHHSATGIFSLRRGPWKCIFETSGSGGWPPPTGGPPESGQPGQLYNLEADPGETNNLWDERPEIVSELAQRLMSYQQTGRSN